MDSDVEEVTTPIFNVPKRRLKLTSEERQNLKAQRTAEKKKKEAIESEEKRKAALNQMRYLLSKCDQYLDVYKKQVDQPKVKVRQMKNGEMKPKEVLKDRNVYTLKTEDIETVAQNLKPESQAQATDVANHLKYFDGGTLHPYQVDGVNWMFNLFLNSSNGILADEMGLGKTIQIIALICTLLEQNVKGPFMILAPLSTIPNWESEFKRFAPKVPVVVMTARREVREIKMKLIRRKYKIGDMETYPVVVMSYETIRYLLKELSAFKWRYIIVDEGQIIKNPESQLGIRLRSLQSENRLILTGTPLQNNLIELWTILNFLVPNFFVSMSTFAELIVAGDLENKEKIIQEEQSNKLVSQVHKVLEPFMLRRLKKDVLPALVPKKEITVCCPISDLQRRLYGNVLHRNIKALRNLPDDSEKVDVDAPRPKRKCTLKNTNYHDRDDSMKDDWLFVDEDSSQTKTNQHVTKTIAQAVIYNLKMTSPFTMLQKIVNHPYLAHFPLDPSSKERRLLISEELVKSSGKFQVLDKLLPALKKGGHKILLFSQTIMLLDVLEDYLIFRNHNYRRLDGNCTIEDRVEAIHDFTYDPDVFIFLITTRAGGVGLNLTAADTVIFYDKDWNPQKDIQAQARCHRIGQDKPVVVYTLTIKNTIEDHICNRGSLKLVLEKVILPDKKFKGIKKTERVPALEALLELQKALDKPSTDSCIFSDKLELKRLLDRSDLYAEMSKKAIS